MCVYTTSFLRFLYLYDCLLLQFCAKLFVHVCVHGNLNINACVCIYARVCVYEVEATLLSGLQR